MTSKKGPILLIDDDADECELIKDALKLEQIENEVICFSNGLKALTFLKSTSQQPFLIFSDINMPGMNGLELRERINENEQLRRKSIPFVFLTTSAGTTAIKAAYEMSVQGFFEKPHLMSEIRKLMREICYYWLQCRHPNE